MKFWLNPISIEIQLELHLTLLSISGFFVSARLSSSHGSHEEMFLSSWQLVGVQREITGE